MKATCKLKYQSCVYVCTALLNLWITLAETTGDPFWGTGLNVAQTLECIPDYWLGSNHMGKILMDIQAKLQQFTVQEDRKCKAMSPLESTSKSVCS